MVLYIFLCESQSLNIRFARWGLTFWVSPHFNVLLKADQGATFVFSFCANCFLWLFSVLIVDCCTLVFSYLEVFRKITLEFHNGSTVLLKITLRWTLFLFFFPKSFQSIYRSSCSEVLRCLKKQFLKFRKNKRRTFLFDSTFLIKLQTSVLQFY